MLALLGAGLITGLATWWSLAGGHVKISLKTALVKRGEVTSTISASGTIEPEEVVDVGAQVAGLIKSFGTDEAGKQIDYGSVVTQGAVLAKIDESVYAADLAVARAQMEQGKAGELSAAATEDQMKAKLTQAEAEWKRAQSLYESKLLARVDYDTDQANYEVAKANVSVAGAALAQARAATVQAQAGLDKAQRNLDFCVIQSPVTGVIIDRRVNIGQTVVVKNGTVLAVEAFEGTNECVKRGGAMGRGNATMVKVSKPGQDMRFDVPVVGPETISHAAAAGVDAIGVEAGKTLILGKEEVIRLCQTLKVSLVAVGGPK